MPDLRSNLGHCGGKTATNRLSYGTTIQCFYVCIKVLSIIIVIVDKSDAVICVKYSGNLLFGITDHVSHARNSIVLLYLVIIGLLHCYLQIPHLHAYLASASNIRRII
jgi:hypothetical protein